MSTDLWLHEWFTEHTGYHRYEGIPDDYQEAHVLDSLGIVGLVVSIESEWGFSFTQEDFDDPRFVTISGLAEIIEEKRG